MSISFTKLGKFSFIIVSDRFPISYSLLLLAPHDTNVGPLEVVPEAPYSIYHFLLDSFCLLVVLIGCFLLPCVPNH